MEPGEGLSPRIETPHPALRATFSHKGRRDARHVRQFVFATRGGVAVVMNWVASSMAVPSGVGITMR